MIIEVVAPYFAYFFTFCQTFIVNNNRIKIYKEFKVEFEIMVPSSGAFLRNTVYSVFTIYADKGKDVYIRFKGPNIAELIGVSGWSRLNDQIIT